MTLVVGGAGMAGLCAAVRATELGARCVVYEKGTRAGGSMLLSSGVVWRHRRFEDFRAECPGGDPDLQRLVWEGLDEALEWLVSLGAPVVAAETGNPLTTGVRFDPAGLVAALLARLPQDAVVLGTPLPRQSEGPTLLATGGFAASPGLVARHIRPAAPLRLRGNPWSTGDGIERAVAAGASLGAGMGEFYGRNMPDAPWSEADYVPAAQLYARRARIFDADGEEFFRAGDVSWSETNVVAATARRPGARAFYLLDRAALADEAVAAKVARAPAEARVMPSGLPFVPPAGIELAVRVTSAITHTIGGLRVDGRARVLDAGGVPVDGLFAAGVDVGEVATGGYASGLAQALVLGLTAAESALA